MALVLAAAAALGYWSGLRNDASGDQVSETHVILRGNAIAAKSGDGVDAEPNASAIADTTLQLPPDELWKLDGEDFLDALPELERRARGGDMDALRVIYRRLTGCVGYQPRTDAQIRARAEEDYARSADIERDARARDPDWELPPGIPSAEERREEHCARASTGERCAPQWIRVIWNSGSTGRASHSSSTIAA
jgi:hypothetical protein